MLAPPAPEEELGDLRPVVERREVQERVPFHGPADQLRVRAERRREDLLDVRLVEAAWGRGGGVGGGARRPSGARAAGTAASGARGERGGGGVPCAALRSAERRRPRMASSFV